MNVQADKLKIIEWIINTEDQSIIRELISIIHQEKSEYETLTEEQKLGIKKGIQDFAEGRFREHHDVVADIKAKYLTK